MPYIKQYHRQLCDEVVSAMVDSNITAGGDLNYILFKYAKYHIPHNYNSLKNYIGELDECIAEIRRRILAPYEDEKIKENGDV